MRRRKVQGEGEKASLQWRSVTAYYLGFLQLERTSCQMTFQDTRQILGLAVAESIHRILEMGN